MSNTAQKTGEWTTDGLVVWDLLPYGNDYTFAAGPDGEQGESDWLEDGLPDGWRWLREGEWAVLAWNYGSGRQLMAAIHKMLYDKGQTPHDAQVGYDCNTFYYGSPVRGTTVITWGDVAGGNWEPDDSWTEEDYLDAAIALADWCQERVSEWDMSDDDNEEND